MVEESSQVACPITTKLVLDEDDETKEPMVQVHGNLVTKLKPHQVDGKGEGVCCVSCNSQEAVIQGRRGCLVFVQACSSCGTAVVNQ